MVARRKNFKKKTYKKKNNNYKLARTVRSGIVSVSKTYAVGTIQQASTSVLSNSGGATFTINSSGDLLSYAALYDKYRICAVKLRFLPSFTENSGTVAAAQGGQIWTYWDNTDIAFPSGVLEIMERKRYKVHNSSQRWTEYSKSVTPLDMEYKSVATTGYAQGNRRKWMSTADPTIPYYAWKWYAENMQNYNYVNVYATLYVQFKDPK